MDAMNKWPPGLRNTIYSDHHVTSGGLLHQFSGDDEAYHLFQRLAERACVYVGHKPYLSPAVAWVNRVYDLLGKAHPDLARAGVCFGVPMRMLAVNVFDASAKAIDVVMKLGDADVLWANARWITKNSAVTSDDLRTRRYRFKDIQTRPSKRGKQIEYYLPDVESVFPTKAPALVKKFRIKILGK